LSYVTSQVHAADATGTNDTLEIFFCPPEIINLKPFTLNPIRLGIRRVRILSGSKVTIFYTAADTHSARIQWRRNLGHLGARECPPSTTCWRVSYGNKHCCYDLGRLICHQQSCARGQVPGAPATSPAPSSTPRLSSSSQPLPPPALEPSEPKHARA